ncbi:MAG: helix-turn-helix domain-containing protein [Chitinophaga sp.]|uniref:GlxA family transcriptional regulator n=1 Tax=Chitinophaga sp. TaxID=1869181 RepID=UPI0025C4428E|nr:helix-turn-helix domain-containing protein [Chitinophaga sp.]MBV8253415.1 helix-turn-helix domain-containing protein [Chitinophaga sp.]
MKQVTIILPAGETNLSSVMGTLEILRSADEYWQKLGNGPKMEIRVAAVPSELKHYGQFYSLHPLDIKDIKKHDLVIIPSVTDPGGYERLISNNKILIEWLCLQYKKDAEIASICTGAFLLAATGLLDGKICSTHWKAERDFRRLFPNVDLHIDKLLIAGQGLYTNGGAFSFLNLILFLVEKFFDRQTAIYCSKVFQIDFDRTSQSPFTIFQPQKHHNDEVVSRAQVYMEENPGEKISFEKLASKLAVSRRNFDRRFIKATGNTPVEYMQRIKMEVAKNLLEKGRKTMFEIMEDVGYNDERTFKEIFKRITGMSPVDYKAKFN